MCLGFKEKKVDKMWRKNHRKNATHHHNNNHRQRTRRRRRRSKTKRSVPPPPPKTRARKVVKECYGVVVVVGIREKIKPVVEYESSSLKS